MIEGAKSLRKRVQELQSGACPHAHPEYFGVTLSDGCCIVALIVEYAREQVEHLGQQHAIGLADLREELRLAFETCRAYEASEGVAWRDLAAERALRRIHDARRESAERECDDLRAQLQTLRGERDAMKADVAAARMLSRDAQLKAGTLAQDNLDLRQEKAALEEQIKAMQETTTPDHTPPPGWHSWGDKCAALEARERALREAAEGARSILTTCRRLYGGSGLGGPAALEADCDFAIRKLDAALAPRPRHE